MPQPASEVTPSVRRSLNACTGDGATYSFMVGSGETYFAAFVLALGASDEAGGLISSIPLLMGAILQLAAPRMAEKVGSPRRWVAICAVVQFLSFVPMVIGALTGGIPVPMVFACISLYWAAALGAGPTWSTWVATIFPARLRARYFALRNRLCQIVQLGGIIGAGLILARFEHVRSAPVTDHAAQAASVSEVPEVTAVIDAAGAGSVTEAPMAVDVASVSEGAAAMSGSDLLLPGFALIMAIAALSRLSSVLFLRAQHDAPEITRRNEVISVKSTLARIVRGRELRLIQYLLIAQFTVQISAPYFNPYMLRSLSLSKSEYLLMVATLFASKSLFLPLHGHFARRFGARRLLMVSGVGIVGLSAAWVVSPSLWYLVPLQALNGCVWGAWELATFLLMLEMIPDRERTGVLTVFNLLNCTAMVIGSLAGALLLSSMGAGREAYLTLFLLSSLLRLAALPALWAIGRERRPPSQALTVAAQEAAGRSAPGSQGRAALPAFSGPAKSPSTPTRRSRPPKKGAPGARGALRRFWRRGGS
ncbi:MAG: MFS transporter [Phycisphaeraceae bacterium]|nr:MFS transporter [Phycisphaeraceae bacterium]